MLNMDEDAIWAAVDLAGRAGARQLQVGYLHEDVPPEQAGWYAHALYRGARVTEEDHRGPVEALDALARRLFTGARGTHCGGLVALSDTGAVGFPGVPRPDGSTWTEEQIRAAGRCHWGRVGPRLGPRVRDPT
jgi:hypothetical protein